MHNMMKNDDPLPTPRDLLTSLISSLSSIPVADTVTTATSHRSSAQAQTGTNPPPNPLRLIPPAYRPLLATLHVLYPTTLLPALDLLDRRLVSRVVLRDDTARGDTHVRGGDAAPPSPPLLYHLVRSAQPQSRGRHRHATSSGGRAYMVRLGSWNCTCAAFAFSAFPPVRPPSASASAFAPGYPILPAGTATTTTTAAAAVEGGGDGGNGGGRTAWEFGGLSADDGRDGAGGVPCCKHLLACVLAERWGAVLGGYLQEHLVGREEAAGLVGDM